MAPHLADFDAMLRLAAGGSLSAQPERTEGLRKALRLGPVRRVEVAAAFIFFELKVWEKPGQCLGLALKKARAEAAQGKVHRACHQSKTRLVDVLGVEHARQGFQPRGALRH